MNPTVNLASFVDGSSWTVDFYQQVLGADSSPAVQDPTKKAPFQQYNKIKSLELIVTQALGPGGQDTETKEFSITGGGVAYGFLKPNVCDMFIANVDNGQLAIFTVTSSEKASYMKSANYQIEYKLVSYIDPVLVNDLNTKSVQVFRFVKTLFQDGQYPLLSESKYATFGGLHQLYDDLVALYFRDFFSISRQTMLVPDQPTETYDHFVTRALVEIVSTDDSVTLPKLRMPAVEGDRAMINVTVWDALLRTNKTTLITGIQRMGVIPTVVFRNLPHLTGIFYTGIDQLVYPKEDRTDVDAEYGWSNVAASVNLVDNGTSRYTSLERTLREKDDLFFATGCKDDSSKSGVDALPVIVPVTQDDFYVFTQGFYGVIDAPLASQLESLTRTAVTGKSFDPERLSLIGAQAFGWPNLERFYYIPAILALIRIALRSN